VNPTVPSQLARTVPVSGWRVHVIVVGGKDGKANAKLFLLRGALYSVGFVFCGAQCREQHGGQDGNDRDNHQKLD
jgi:hypothetical protein